MKTYNNRLTVRDTGDGIAPEVLERIFDPYFTTKVVCGMGLAVVHGTVRSHDGAIEVESTPGKGSTFNVFFPDVVMEAEVKRHKSEVSLRGPNGFYS